MGPARGGVVLSCKEIAQVCSDEFERPLKLGERAALHLHLMMCPGCSTYREQLGTLRQVMRAYADGRAPPGEAAGVGDEPPA